MLSKKLLGKKSPILSMQAIFLLNLVLLSAISCLGKAEEMEARQAEVKQTIVKMINAIDTKEWAVALSQFSEVVFVDYSSLSGQEGAEVKSRALVDGWKKLLDGPAKVETHHILSNFDITVSGDEAESFSHVYASHQAEGAGYWDAYGRYHHKLKKTGDGWKIVFKKLIMHGQKGNRSFLSDISK